MGRIAQFRLLPFAVVVALTLILLAAESRLVATSAVAGDRPQLSPPSGQYLNDLLVRMDSPHPSATVLFTTDGSEPRPGSAAEYRRPLALDAALSSVTVVRPL